VNRRRVLREDARMRTRRVLLVAVVTAALVSAGAAPAAAVSERSAAASAVPGRLLQAPRAEALVTRLPVRIVVRVPARTSRLSVRVGGRDVTARFSRGRGSRRVARLTPGDGLRYGVNHLVVLAERPGGRRVIDARPFVLARRDPDLVRLRMRKGPVTKLAVRVAGGLALAPPHFAQLRTIRRRLSVMQRRRIVRLSLNGRRVNRALDRSRLTRWNARLSATHGLRYGVNRLRILVAEPKQGRYALVRRRFRIRRGRPLAAAGYDVGTRLGGRVRLDGRRSRVAGGRPDHSWRIVSRPRGSRVELRRAGSARPFLKPDRQGRYVIRNTVRARGKAGRVSTDDVTLTSAPEPLLIPFQGLTVDGGQAGIQVGGTFFRNPSPTGRSMQWLTLNRLTLDPSTAQNNWLDGTGSGANGLNTLTQALSGGNLNQLVILSFPGGSGPPVQQDQIDAFNSALAAIGVGPISSDVLQAQNKLVIAGVPTGGSGSGQYIHGGAATNGLTGWLMPDGTPAPSGANRFRVQPERPPFSTSSASTATTNTMSVRDQQVSDTLPAGATGGFQVVLIDPTDFTVVDHRAFPTNGLADVVSGPTAMAQYLNEHASSATNVAVQSIGQVTDPQPPENPNSPNPGDDAWRAMVSALTAYGANPHTLYSANGRYAFVGGTKLDKSDVAQSSSTVVIDPSTGKNQSGTLGGRVGMRDDGYFTPAAVDASKSFAFALYDIAFKPPTPWPHTLGAPGVTPAEATQYAAALDYITTNLPLLSGWAPDVRRSYVGNDDIVYADSRQDLIGMQYPGSTTTCGTASASQQPPGQVARFTLEQFCQVNRDLQKEFEYLDAVKALFNAWSDALNRSANQEQVDLNQIGTNIINTIDRPIGGAEVGWTLGGFVGNMISAGLVLNPTVEPLAVWEGLVVVYELIRELVSDPSGFPLGEQIQDEVDSLSLDVATRLSDAAMGLDGLRDVITSDAGRLSTLGTAAFGPGWAIDTEKIAATLTLSADAFFYGELMPIAYDTVWYLKPSNDGDNTTDTCEGLFFTHPWRGTPPSAQMQWSFGFNSDFGPQRSGLFLLGKTGAGTDYAPQNLSDRMFQPLSQSGLGVHLPDFFWTRYQTLPVASYQCG
jgi:hypothetical protein